MNAIIIDDERPSIEVLTYEIQQHCKEIRIVQTFEESTAAQSWLIKNQIDLVFLDIMMPRLNGIELLKLLQPFTFQVIFTTAYDQYTLQAMRLSAIDYLLKPVDTDELKQAVRRAHEMNRLRNAYERLHSLEHNILPNQSNKKIVVPTTMGFEYKLLNDIFYFEADANYSTLHLMKDKIFVTKPLKEMEELLTPLGFHRIHHKYLIHLNQMMRFNSKEDEVVLTNHVRLPVARDRKAQFLDRITI